MALTHAQMLSLWDRHRIHSPSNQCSCDHCCQSNNICAHCQQYAGIIDWHSQNPPHISCSQCKHSYHFDCLPVQCRFPNSWRVCSEIGSEYSCSSFTDLFSFLWKRDPSRRETSESEALITIEYESMYPNKRLSIKDHFCGFSYNGFKYVVGDCVEVTIHHEYSSDSTQIARIVDIFCTDTDAMIFVQWYRYPLSENEHELYFADNSVDLVSIQNVKCRVRVEDEMERFNQLDQRLKEQKRRWHSKLESIHKLRDSKKRERNGDHNESNGCIIRMREDDEWMPFDKVFWSNKSTNEETMDVYDTNIDDTRFGRMKVQKEMLKQCKMYRDRLKEERVKRINNVKEEKKKVIPSTDSNSNVINDSKPIHEHESDDDDDSANNALTNNRKRKRSPTSSDESEDEPILLLKPRPKKRRLNPFAPAPVAIAHLLDESENEEEDVVTLKEEEYLSLGQEIHSLKQQLAEAQLKINAMKCNEESVSKLKKMEEECINLRRMNTDLRQKEIKMLENKQKFINQVADLRREYESVRSDYRQKQQKLLRETKRSDSEYERKIKKLKDKTVKLSHNLRAKEERIKYFEKLRQFDAGKRNIRGAECIMVNQIPMLITDAPPQSQSRTHSSRQVRDPRLRPPPHPAPPPLDH